MGEPLHHQAGTRIAADAGKAFAYLAMGLFAFMTIAPIVWLALSSFKSTQEFRMNRAGLPHVWVLVNYPGAWHPGLSAFPARARTSV